MQDQAAPERFHGPYPHCISIPDAYIPKDKFIRNQITQALKNHKTGIYHEELQNHEQVLTYEKDAQDQMIELDYKDGVYTGHFPRLILNIKDKELQDVVKNKCGGDFDKLDLKDIKCTCSEKPSYEEIFDQSVSNRVGERDAILYKTCKRCILAAAKRQMKAAPTVDKHIAADFLQYSINKIEEWIGEDLNNFKYSFSQWFNHLSKPKQDQMKDIINTLNVHDENITFHNMMQGDVDLKDILKASNKYTQKYWHYEAICKAEIQDKDGKPRMVCKIPGLMKLIMGPITWKLEDIATKKIPCYCGGMNLQQMGDKINHYIDEGFTVVAQGDGSAFDNTQDILLKGLDRYIYNRIPNDAIYHVHPDLFRMASNQYYKIMDVLHRDPITKKVETLLSYAILGTVFSGDCDTTLMNTLRMGLYNMYTNEKAGLKHGVDFICFSKGDDFTVMYKSYITQEIANKIYEQVWLKKASPKSPNEADNRIFGLGQILKFIELGPPKIFEFCSLKAYYIDDDQHIYLTRNPQKLTTLGRYSRKIKSMNDLCAAEYMLSLKEAIDSSYSQLEYFSQVAQCYATKAQWYLNRAQYTMNKTKRFRKRELKVKEQVPIEFPDALREDENLMFSDYWESVKAIYMRNPTVLSAHQARYVNEQIKEMDMPIPSEVLTPQ